MSQILRGLETFLFKFAVSVLPVPYFACIINIERPEILILEQFLRSNGRPCVDDKGVYGNEQLCDFLITDDVL